MSMSSLSFQLFGFDYSIATLVLVVYIPATVSELYFLLGAPCRVLPWVGLDEL